MLRFRLRTLLIAVAVCCVSLGLLVAAIRERNSILKEVRQSGGDCDWDESRGPGLPQVLFGILAFATGGRSPDIITVPRSMRDRIDTIRWLYPEATVVEAPE
jgi:hypothetical protein